MKNTTAFSEIRHLLWLGGSSVALVLSSFARMWEWGAYWNGFFAGTAAVLLAVGTVGLVRKFREMWNKPKRYGNH